MVLFTFKMRRFVAAAALGAILGSSASAQPTAVTPTSASSEKSVDSPSVFDGYKPYTDEPLGNWKAANDNVGQIGGWREYAKQAQQPDNMPAAAGKAVEPISKPLTKPINKAKP